MKASRNQIRTVRLLAREQGIHHRDLFLMLLDVRGREDDGITGLHNELALLTSDEVVRLLKAMRDLPVNEEGREAYRRDDEDFKRMYERDRKAAARMTLDDPHLRAQREGWGL